MVYTYFSILQEQHFTTRNRIPILHFIVNHTHIFWQYCHIPLGLHVSAKCLEWIWDILSSYSGLFDYCIYIRLFHILHRSCLWNKGHCSPGQRKWKNSACWNFLCNKLKILFRLALVIIKCDRFITNGEMNEFLRKSLSNKCLHCLCIYVSGCIKTSSLTQKLFSCSVLLYKTTLNLCRAASIDPFTVPILGIYSYQYLTVWSYWDGIFSPPL